jgi:hypothetical protein
MTVLDESLYSYAYASTQANVPPGQIIPPGTTIKDNSGKILKGGAIPSTVSKGTPGQPGASSPMGMGGNPNKDPTCTNTATDIGTQFNKLLHGCSGAMDCTSWGPLAPLCMLLQQIQMAFGKYGKFVIPVILIGGGYLVYKKVT